MTARPGFIEIAGIYYATIKVGAVETVLKEGDRRIPFDSAIAAVSAARRALMPMPSAVKKQEPDDFALWKREKADELNRLRDEFALNGVKVEIRKRKRAGV